MIQNFQNIQLVVSAEQLKSIVYECVCKAMAEHTAETAEASTDPSNKLYTADEVCELLHVTKPTLWRWSKVNYLCPVKVGTKNFYKCADVERLTNK